MQLTDPKDNVVVPYEQQRPLTDPKDNIVVPYEQQRPLTNPKDNIVVPYEQQRPLVDSEKTAEDAQKWADLEKSGVELIKGVSEILSPINRLFD